MSEHGGKRQGNQTNGEMKMTKAEQVAKLLNDAWKDDAHGINGTRGNHYDLARYAEAKGFVVEADPDDNQQSLIVCGDRVIGRIVGYDEAEIVITADLN